MSSALQKTTKKGLLPESLWKAADLAVNILYPRRCPVCDRPVRPMGALICPECEGVPRRVGTERCLRCGRKVPAHMEYCRGCRERRHYFARGCSAFSYAGIRTSLYRFKYMGRQEYAAWYGQEMTKALAQRVRKGGFPRPDLIVPVPLSDKRMRKRGYNQAALLAREVSKRCHVPCLEGALLRVRDTKPLKTEGVLERQENLKRSFLVYGNDVKLKSIMLIDDIYTTGATVDACARALLSAGAVSVTFLTLASGDETKC